MNGEEITTYSLKTYDISRLIFCFDKSGKSDSLRAYTKTHGQHAKLEGLRATETGLTFAEPGKPGVFTSDVVEAEGFDWMVPWINADSCGDASIRVDLQVEIDGAWSAWLPVWRWGSRSASFSGGEAGVHLESDTVLLDQKATKYRIRCLLGSASGAADLSVKEEDAPVGASDSAVLRRCGVITRDKSAPRSLSRGYLLRESSFRVLGRSQMAEHPSIKGRICSPTSDAMALDFFGRHYPTCLVAADCYDLGARIYGNWAFNVASLWRLGACARLDFFPNLELASQELFSGRLLVASVAFEAGALSGSPIQRTSGHLILITGLRKNLDGTVAVLVNDPAAPRHEEVARSYRLEEFEKAWKGIVYVVERRG